MVDRSERQLPSARGFVTGTLSHCSSIAVGVISAVALVIAADTMAQGTEMKGDAARGRALFVSKGCIACHAIKEVGGASAPPLDAEGVAGEVDPFDFVARMWRGAEAMIFMQQQELGEQLDFTGQDLADIIAFVHDPEAQRTFSEADVPPALRRRIRKD
jgi:mono/diheme cytochrome c family protein